MRRTRTATLTTAMTTANTATPIETYSNVLSELIVDCAVVSCAFVEFRLFCSVEMRLFASPMAKANCPWKYASCEIAVNDRVEKTGTAASPYGDRLQLVRTGRQRSRIHAHLERSSSRVRRRSRGYDGVRRRVDQDERCRHRVVRRSSEGRRQVVLILQAGQHLRRARQRRARDLGRDQA